MSLSLGAAVIQMLLVDPEQVFPKVLRKESPRGDAAGIGWASSALGGETSGKPGGFLSPAACSLPWVIETTWERLTI